MMKAAAFYIISPDPISLSRFVMSQLHTSTRPIDEGNRVGRSRVPHAGSLECGFIAMCCLPFLHYTCVCRCVCVCACVCECVYVCVRACVCV